MIFQISPKLSVARDLPQTYLCALNNTVVWIDFVFHCVKITYSLINSAFSWMWPSRDHKDVLCSLLTHFCCKTCLMMMYHSQLVTETYWFMLGMILKTRTLWLANNAFSFVCVTTVSQRIFLVCFVPFALQRTVKCSSFCYRNCARLWSNVYPRFFIITNYSAWQPGRLYLKLH